MEDESKNNNNQKNFRSFRPSIQKKANLINISGHIFDGNISSKIQFLMRKSQRTKNKNADIIFLNDNIGFNINGLNTNIYEDKLARQSIGVNTSNHYDMNKKAIPKKEKQIRNQNNIKQKVGLTKPYSALFKKYVISYEENKKKVNNPEQAKDFQIPKLKKKKFNTISVSSMKKEKKPIINEIVPIKNRDKESLLTYNFNKDTYSKEQRLLINVLNNNFNTSDINRIHNRLKRTQTKKNYKTMIYSNEDIKTMSNKNKKNIKYKLFNKTNLFHHNPNNSIPMNHTINKDIKNTFCNSLLKHVLSNNDYNSKNINNEDKIFQKEEVIKLMEYPDSIFNYILVKLKEFNNYQSKRNGIKLKMENMKTDLKLTEQKALYELINLKYFRIPGEEINIKTNLFCVKNINKLICKK